MKKTKLYSLLLVVVMAISLMITAILFIKPQKVQVASADTTYNTTDNTYYTDIANALDDRNMNDIYLVAVVSPSNELIPGSTFTVQFKLLNCTAGFVNMQSDIAWDESIEYVTDNDKDDHYVPLGFESDCYLATKTLCYMASNPINYTATSTITLLTITFRLKNNCVLGDYYISLPDFEINGYDKRTDDFYPITCHYPTQGFKISAIPSVSTDASLAANNPVVRAENASGLAITGSLGDMNEVDLNKNSGGGRRHTQYQTYTLTQEVGYGTENLYVSAVANDTKATVKFKNSTGYAAASNATYAISSATTAIVSETTVYTLENVIEVTAEYDDANYGYVRYYSISFTMSAEVSHDVTLESVKLSNGSKIYNTTYNESSKTYTVVDAESQALSMAYQEAAAGNWSIVVEATSAAANVAGKGAVTLTPGQKNQFNLTVTAGDGTTTETYKVEVNVIAADTRNTLSEIKLVDFDTRAIEKTATASATISKRYDVAELDANQAGKQWILTATPTSSLATVTYKNGETLLATSNGKTTLTLPAGKTEIRITVTPESGEAETYTVVIPVHVELDTDIRALKVDGTAVAHDEGDFNTYTVKLAASVASFNLGVEVSENASVRVIYDGEVTPLNGVYPIAIDDDATGRITVEVTSATTVVTYIVNVSRLNPDASLASLAISNGVKTFYATLDGTTYTINNVPYADAVAGNWKIVAIPTVGGATVSGDGNVTDLSGAKTISVTPETGAAVNYTLNVNVVEANADVTLSLSAGSVALKTDGSTFYAIVNYDNVKSVTLSAKAHELSTVKINGETVTEKAISLTAGNNTVTVTVTAENGQSKEYTVKISAYEVANNASYITFGGAFNDVIKQSDYFTTASISREYKVDAGTTSSSFTVSLPAGIKVEIVYGASIAVQASAGAKPLAASISGSAGSYTVNVDDLTDGNNVVVLKLTDEFTGETTICAVNVLKEAAKKSNGGLIAGMIIFAILFIAAAVVCVLLFLKMKKGGGMAKPAKEKAAKAPKGASAPAADDDDED